MARCALCESLNFGANKSTLHTHTRYMEGPRLFGWLNISAIFRSRNRVGGGQHDLRGWGWETARDTYYFCWLWEGGTAISSLIMTIYTKQHCVLPGFFRRKWLQSSLTLLVMLYCVFFFPFPFFFIIIIIRTKELWE